MEAIVIQVCRCYLLVCDCGTGQTVHVHTDRACCFRCGDHVCIVYSGAMTASLPPQITASRITKMNCAC